MTTLLVGFDSAWTPTNSGAIVGVLRADAGTFRELGSPQVVNYREAEDTIVAWQSQQKPEATIVLLDQPTIVNNASGQRPVENLGDRNLPSARDDRPWLDAAGFTSYRSAAQVQPDAEEDLFDLRLAACLPIGVERVRRVRAPGSR